ncbi:iron-sulfur cluster assembly scaffold protein [Campylobacter fetus]|uniref:iron-sulfur cluster assembly scaffold protein n=1 Tax=Campylobacter fetus TaxID=196 RepID=UPI0003C267D2|nr:iron-sulfur cluster assembly scaffold protein [Campylobacter fetus]AGZ82486.1 iron-sulfur cluster assembly scaffold protein IscU [Campylobacter fetus subsp. testudinum 03-427]EAI4322581.1 iron-sulfur cluster assembly scaffold protein NifU [Campylobacter fetus]EAI4391298.1 iron-sulfur cluster assembly scaffold protein NifU [Campylobacter fetus]EAK0827024.1 iron-sulfur cluster assembly scaffold protein NifU [Campylobacter fetus]OCS06158.1 nitrogen fixation protein NifU [Campylobacter fetus su
MAKGNLISGNIWEEYSQKVQDAMNHPKNMGEITEEQADAMGCELIIADHGAESCGDAVRLYWAVEKNTDIIKDAKFKSFGCGTAIASSDYMAELCKGKTVDEAVKITNIDVEKAMRDTPDIPAVPPQKMHCSVMAYDVIKAAAASYKGVDPEHFEDEIIVCECARVSLGTIKEVIKLNDLKTVEDITKYTKAGAFCKSCIKPGGHEKREYYLVDILAETRAEMEAERLKAVANAKISGSGLDSDLSFEELTVVKQLKAVEAVIDENIRPMLVMDGGNMEILDIKKEDTDGKIDIYIRYLGACSGCASGATGTLYAIENILQENLSPNIRVLPV